MTKIETIQDAVEVLRTLSYQFVCPEDKLFSSIADLLENAELNGYIEGLKAYAWWKDGVQYVGTCGVTLGEAIDRARKELGPANDGE